MLLEVGKYYASVFFAEQAAEKALKAVYMHVKNEPPPRTCNLVELLENLGIKGEDLLDVAMDLTPEYTVARYPDAACGIPASLYNSKIAREHLDKAKLIVSFCKILLERG